MIKPVLYIMGGLPASGKSTLAQCLAKEKGAVYIRIDSIEEAIKETAQLSGPEGYEAAFRIASDNLNNGLSVVADSVNPLEITRSSWRSVAKKNGIRFIEIEIVCSDKNEHRNRLEARSQGQASSMSLTWEQVVQREYEDWKCCLIFDTAGESLEQSKNRFVSEISKLCRL